MPLAALHDFGKCSNAVEDSEMSEWERLLGRRRLKIRDLLIGGRCCSSSGAYVAGIGHKAD